MSNPGTAGPGWCEADTAAWWLSWLGLTWLGSMVMLAGIVGLGVKLGRGASPLSGDVSTDGR